MVLEIKSHDFFVSPALSGEMKHDRSLHKPADLLRFAGFTMLLSFAIEDSGEPNEYARYPAQRQPTMAISIGQVVVEWVDKWCWKLSLTIFASLLR
jgi:hypothetical protein